MFRNGALIRIKKILTCLVLAACLTACGGNNGSKPARKQGSAEQTAAAPKKFPYPEVPSYIGEAAAARDYAAEHFWDRFFASPKDYQDRDLIEGAFAGYATILNSVSPEVSRKAQEHLLALAEKSLKEWPEGDMLSLMLEFCGHYFDDPNSPYRDEECYLPVVEWILSSDLPDEASKARAAYLKPLISLNRPGTVANDFTYTTATGRRGTLHKVKAERTLLFFSNPGCANCKEIIEALSNSPKIGSMIADGTLKVVNIYPDADLTEWYKYLSHYPEEWITGFDAEGVLNANTIYYLRAIPSLYLLDADKRVILKDAPLERLLEHLEQ